MNSSAKSPPPAPQIRKLVIVGGGVDGWMTAAALSRATAGLISITLVEDGQPAEGLAPFGPAEASLPSLRHYHKLLQANEALLTGAGSASFGLGIVFSGWGDPDRSYIQPFGEVGAAIGPVAFHQLAARLRAEGREVRLADYSLAALCAQAGRFAHPATDERSVLATYDYGLHIDRLGYARALRSVAERLGALTIAGSVRSVERGEGGEIAALLLDDGRRIEGDFFADCSGPSARLIGQELGSRFASWSQWLPCDSVLSAECPGPDVPDLYTHAAAHPAGWRRTVPLQNRRGESFVYCSDHLGDEAAEGTFLNAAGASAGLAHSRFRSGRRERAWIGNCVAIGAAAGVLEPLDSTSLHLVQQGIARLIALFPGAPHAPREAAEYNRLTGLALERARDLAILHYKANGRRGEPLWDRCREMEVPESLGRKIELYRSRGRIPLYDEELFEEREWVTIFDGQGIRPRRYDPLADGIPADQLERHLARLREIMIGAAKSMPPHGEYLRRLRAMQGVPA